MTNSLKLVVARIPADPANNSLVQAMQLVKGFIAKKSFPWLRRWHSISHGDVAIQPVLRTLSLGMLSWISVAVAGSMSFWLPAKLGKKAESSV